MVITTGTTEVLECKEKTEKIDDENMMIVLDIFEGDHTNHYQCFVVTTQVVPKGEGSTVKWTVEYAKHNEGATDPHLCIDLLSALSDKLDAHLLAKA